MGSRLGLGAHGLRCAERRSAVSDAGEDQGAEEAFVGMPRESRHVSLERAVWRERLSSFSAPRSLPP